MRLLLFTSAWMQANAPRMLSLAKRGYIAPLRYDCAPTCSVKRLYSTRRGGDSEESTADDGLPKDYKLKTLKAGSRRLDTVINRATGKSSSVIDEKIPTKINLGAENRQKGITIVHFGNASRQVGKLILSGKVLVNESAVTKKAYNVQKADVIDVWNGAFEENTDLAVVDRVEVVDYALTTSGYDIHVKSWKKFLVSNWKQSTQ